MLSLSTSGQSLTLYAIPPVKNMNFKSPHHVVTSIGKNIISKKTSCYPLRPIGHVIVELVSKDKDTTLTGIVADNKLVLYKPVLIEKQGLGILFSVINGHLEEKAILQKEINMRSENGKIAFITYQINDSSFQFLKNYIDSFKILGYHKLYNGTNQPRYGGGTGCSAFGVSFLELINAVDSTYEKEWKLNLPIQNRLIGNSITENRVSLWSVFFSFKWSNEKKPHTHIVLYDPSLMYTWIEKEYTNKNSKFAKLNQKNAHGISFTCLQTCYPIHPMFPNLQLK